MFIMKINPKDGTPYRLRMVKADREYVRIDDKNKVVTIFYKKIDNNQLMKTVFNIMKEIDEIYIPKTLYNKFILYGISLADVDFSMKQDQDRKEKAIYTKVDDNILNRDLTYIEGEILARRIASTPSNIATPEWMVDQAKNLAEQYKLDIEILDKKKLEELGLNMFLSVNRGSDKGAYIVILKYTPREPSKRIVLVGKGLCFDTGGLSIKPARNMYTMHMDKSGASVVLGVMQAISKIKPNVEVWGVLALTENSVDRHSIQPGAVVKAYNGKTVEIVHTDAEGRLVLGDTLAYLYKNFKFDHIITIATLTGAANIAVGRYVTPILGTDKVSIKKIIKAGQEEMEKLWELPLFQEYNELLKSSIADLRNIGGWEGEAGTIIGAKFIEHFTEGNNWVHLDIASRMIDYDFHKDLARAPNTRTLINYLTLKIR